MVVGVYRGLVVVIGEGRHGHVGIDGVVALVVALEVLAEGLGVPAQVEGQLGVIVEGVFLDIGLEILGRCFLEGRHGRHLVVQLDVAEAHLVVGNLAQGIGLGAHVLEVVHGALPVAGEVGNLAGAEEVAPGLLLPAQAFLVVFLGFVHVSLHQETLAQDAAHAGFAVFGDVVQELFSVFDYVVVILGVEAAFQNVELRRLAEAEIVLALAEPLLGLAEVGLGVVHVAQSETGRGCVVRVGFHSLRQDGLGLFPVSVAVRAVTQFVQVFGPLFLGEGLGVYLHQLVPCLFVFLVVKQVLRPQEPHLRHLHMLVKLLHEAGGLLLGAVGL